jgi:hypothetical protein
MITAIGTPNNNTISTSKIWKVTAIKEKSHKRIVISFERGMW